MNSYVRDIPTRITIFIRYFIFNIIGIPYLASAMDQQTAGIRLYFIYNNNQSISDTKDDYK